MTVCGTKGTKMNIDFSQVHCFADYVRLLTEDLLARTESQKRGEAESIISAIAPQILDHILKALMFGRKCQDYEHWCQEIFNWLNGIQRLKLKQNNKNIPFKYLERWACDEIFEEEHYERDLSNVMYQEEAYNPIGYSELKKDFIGVQTLYKTLLRKVSEGKFDKNVLKQELDNWIESHEIIEESKEQK